jgi:acetyltransferase-like isoleucine patch superfamily enzyme
METIVCWTLIVLAALFLLKYMFSFLLISVIEQRHKNKINKSVIADNVKEKESKTFLSKVKSNFYFGFYEGLYKYIVTKVGAIPSNHLRKFIYKHIFKVQIGKNVVMHYGIDIMAGYKIEIGDGTIVGFGCLLDGRSGLKIGKNVNFSSYVSVHTLQHNKNDPFFGGVGGEVSIGDRAWISSNTKILPNVKIGEGAIVCGCACVTKDVTPFSIVAGIPAKEIGKRSSDLKYCFDGKSIWFY